MIGSLRKLTQKRLLQLTARSLHSVYSNVRINQVKTFDVESWESDFVIRGLNPSTVYNVTLKPKDHSEVSIFQPGLG